MSSRPQSRYSGLLIVPAAAVLLAGGTYGTMFGLAFWMNGAEHDSNSRLHRLSCHTLAFRSWKGDIGHYKTPLMDQLDDHSINTYKIGLRCRACGYTIWGKEDPVYDPHLHSGRQVKAYSPFSPND